MAGSALIEGRRRRYRGSQLGAARCKERPLAQPFGGMGWHGSGIYDASMVARRRWIAAFIGHVLRRGFADDPDWAYDVAEEVYPVWAGCDPKVAADSAFGAFPDSPDLAKRVLH